MLKAKCVFYRSVDALVQNLLLASKQACFTTRSTGRDDSCLSACNYLVSRERSAGTGPRAVPPPAHFAADAYQAGTSNWSDCAHARKFTNHLDSMSYVYHMMSENILIV